MCGVHVHLYVWMHVYVYVYVYASINRCLSVYLAGDGRRQAADGRQEDGRRQMDGGRTAGRAEEDVVGRQSGESSKRRRRRGFRQELPFSLDYLFFSVVSKGNKRDKYKDHTSRSIHIAGSCVYYVCNGQRITVFCSLI